MTNNNLELLSCYIILSSKLTTPAKVELLEYIKTCNEYQLKKFLTDCHIISNDLSKKDMIEINENFKNSKSYQILQEVPAAAIGRAIGRFGRGTYKYAGKGVKAAFDITAGVPLSKYLKKKFGLYAKKGMKRTIGQHAGAFFADVAGFMVFNAALIAAWRTTTYAFDQRVKQCGLFTGGEERKRCLLKTKIEFEKKKLNLLRQTGNDCLKQKTPEQINACKDKIQMSLQKSMYKIRSWNEQLKIQDQTAAEEKQAWEEKKAKIK